MKSQMLLIRAVLDDFGTRCCTSTTRDMQYIARRFEAEGQPFLGLTLPKFCEDLQKALSRGSVASTDFVGYAKSGRLPKFLGGFVRQIFEPQTGDLLIEPCTNAILAVRQITLLFSKVKVPCSDARNRAALEKFVEIEQDVRATDRSIEVDLLDDFSRISSLLFDRMFSKIDRMIFEGSLLPKHGPGTTADGLTGNSKFVQTEWPERLDRVFPFEENAIPSWNPLVDSLDVEYLTPDQERPVKVILVPKTLKTPRVIAVEPTCMQYMQQAIDEVIRAEVQRVDPLRSLIGFRLQSPNQVMAREGSLLGNLATLDLSEASDRVSNQVVRRLFRDFRHLRTAVDATRSRTADVPGYGALRLAKFASMGSALCFPVEAMVFVTVVLIGVERARGRPLSRSAIRRMRGKVRVYGDDIIVPVEYVRSVIETLEAFGLKVNSNKSFWTGRFRESCGKEYFAGDDVSVVKVREFLPTSRRQATGVISTVSLRNQMYFSGNWRTTSFLDQLLEGIIPFPHVQETSPVLGRHSFLGLYETHRECRHLQKPLVRAFVESSRSPVSQLDDRFALLKYFLKRGDLPFQDEDHLERAGRPSAVYIKRRWAPSY